MNTRLQVRADIRNAIQRECPEADHLAILKSVERFWNSLRVLFYVSMVGFIVVVSGLIMNGIG